jgi:alanine dehydrogenase
VPHTSTYALTNVTLPYVTRLVADPIAALLDDEGLRRGVNVARGKVTDAGVADAHDLPVADAADVLGA